MVRPNDVKIVLKILVKFGQNLGWESEFILNKGLTP